MTALLPISRVVVHRDGALVHRSGTVTAEAGRLEVPGLPLLLDESSVRATIAGARLDRLRLELDIEGVERGAEPTEVRDLAEAERALQQLRAERTLLRTEREALEHLTPGPPSEDPEQIPSPTTLTGWAGLQPAIAEWSAALDDRLHPLDEAIRRAEEHSAQCRWALEQASDEALWRRWAPTRRAVAWVEGDGPCEVEISYLVRGACWSPAYALHADAAFRKGRLVVRALVAQATGEDWHQVAVALSTAPCYRDVEIPELPALRLGTRQPPAASPWRDLPPDLDALFPEELEGWRWLRDGEPPRTVGLDDFAAVSIIEQEEGETDEEATGGWDAIPDAAPQAPPAAFPMVEASRKSAGAASAFGGLVSGAVDALASLAEPEQPKGRASGAADRRQAAPLRPSRAPAPGGYAVPAPPTGLEVGANALDYPHLRLASFDAEIGVRGRLQATDVAREAEEAGVPAPGVRRLLDFRLQLLTSANQTKELPLPPHHVLPGPIEGADFRYDAREGVDLPSDGRFHTVAVFTRPLTLDVRHRAVTLSDPRAFRTVRAALEDPIPLLPGPIDVFVDGGLEVSTPWKGSATGATLEFGLGVDDSIRVARNVRYREESAGIFGGDRRLHTEIEVKLASSLSRVTEVELLDRRPVPAGDDVTVELVASSPTAEAWEGDGDGPILKGGLRQVVKVPPGGEATATIHYAVTLSGKNEISGGDRRG